VGGFLLGLLMITGGSDVAGAVVMVLGIVGALVFWAVVRIWIFVRIKFAMSAVVLERIGVGSALGRSWRLTQGSWWRIFLILFLTLIISYFVSNILLTPFMGGGIVPAILAPGALWAAVLAGALMFIGQAVTYAIVTPFEVGVATLLYVDLRMRREGLDLKLHTAALSGQEVGPEIYLPEQRA
jgi:membrane-anchored glycerophosphoryl diester phosphodiesterase (GDPDase)